MLCSLLNTGSVPQRRATFLKRTIESGLNAYVLCYHTDDCSEQREITYFKRQMGRTVPLR